MRKSFLFGFLLLFFLVATGCNIEPDTGQKVDNNKSVTTEKKEVKPVIYKQGDSVEIDGMKMTIPEVKEYQSSNQFMDAKDGYKYLAVMIEVENVSDESKSYNPLYYKLNNKDGSNYDTAFTDIDPSFSSGTLQPTRKAKGYLAFEVPSDVATNQLEFIYEPLTFNASQVIWELN